MQANCKETNMADKVNSNDKRVQPKEQADKNQGNKDKKDDKK
jgi:hypothetical protein